MSNYTFTFKKGDIIAEFTTTDKLAVERQFPIWVAGATEAAKKTAQKQPKTEEKKTSNPKPPVTEKVEPPVQKPQEPVFVEPEVKIEVEQEIEQPVVEEKVQEIVQEVPAQEPVNEVVSEVTTHAPESDNAQVFDTASDLLKTINTIQNPQENVPVEEVVDFEKVLVESIENPTFEPNQTKDEKFLEVVASKNTSDRFHYLIITAYYLLEYEKMQRFSLKQINAKLMNNLSRVVDHTILREAINQEFVEVVPDLTGSSEAAEYRLTAKGEDFYFSGF